MAHPLSTYLTRLAENPRALAERTNDPVLLWEAGLFTPEEGTDLMLTMSGQANFCPSPENPLVLVVRSQGTQSSATGISIGRSETSDIVVQNRSVSRLHALIHHDTRADRWLVTDAGSHNGTEVDGKPVGTEDPVALEDGARVRVGDVELKFLLAATFLEHLQSKG